MSGDRMKKILKYFPVLLIIVFLGLYFSYQNGYYESVIRDKMALTNQNIEKFEQDVKDGHDITLDDYFIQEKNYSTKASSISLKVSNKLENIIDSGIKYLFRKIASVVE